MSSSSAVYLHIGLPKTGTTFLQHILAANRTELLKQGLIYPGERDDHFFPVQDVMQQGFRGHLDERATGAWDATVEEVSPWAGKALISHELMARASADQIASIVTALCRPRDPSSRHGPRHSTTTSCGMAGRDQERKDD